MSTLMFRI